MSAAKTDPRQEERFTGDPEFSFSLPATYYTDPVIFASEREKVFFRSWMFVGHVTDAANSGDYFTAPLFNQSLIMIRGRDNELRAFYNVCRHRGHELLNGTGCVSRITCPYHAWTYGLDGVLRAVRNVEHVKGFRTEDFPLRSVRLEIMSGLVFVNLDPDAEPLKVQAKGLEEEILELAPNAHELVHAYRTENIIACNWKIAVENWSECYHCAVVHKPLATEFIDFDTHRVIVHPHYQRQHMRLHCDVPSSVDGHEAGDEQASWTLMPNLGVQIVSGGYLMTAHWEPLDPDHCRFVENWYLPASEPTERQWEMIRFRADHTQPEDDAVCEAVQRGLHSRGYGQGRLMVDAERSAISEHGSHHIQHWVKQKLQQA
ncbi:MAG: aromatic ring-hydroxylating dioxygenase subunit alpha [Alphaproteobacteria bacterium]|nr:aromatic ring-hydroxylating dioxygenase subunit alpha [Alphaproteobacteria bacterium]